MEYNYNVNSDNRTNYYFTKMHREFGKCPLCDGFPEMKTVEPFMGQKMYYMQCSKCGIHTFVRYTADEAIVDWNMGIFDHDSKIEQEEVEPCIKCGKKPELVVIEPYKGKILYYMKCTNCGQVTNAFDTERDAVGEWDIRNYKGENDEIFDLENF